MYPSPSTAFSYPTAPINEVFSSYFTSIGSETSAVSNDFDFEKIFAAASRFIWDIKPPAPFEKDENSVLNGAPLSCNNSYMAPTTGPGPVRNTRQCLYCNICQKNITEDGKLSQGPRRHILQHHLRRPLFLCPHCPATSNYDKTHISNHIRKIHQGLGGEVVVEKKNKYMEEYNRWFKRCFKTESESRVHSSNEKTGQTKAQLDSCEDDNKENTLGSTPSFNPPRSLPFPIERILAL